MGSFYLIHTTTKAKATASVIACYLLAITTHNPDHLQSRNMFLQHDKLLEVEAVMSTVLVVAVMGIFTPGIPPFLVMSA